MKTLSVHHHVNKIRPMGHTLMDVTAQLLIQAQNALQPTALSKVLASQSAMRLKLLDTTQMDAIVHSTTNVTQECAPVINACLHALLKIHLDHTLMTANAQSVLEAIKDQDVNQEYAQIIYASQAATRHKQQASTRTAVSVLMTMNASTGTVQTINASSPSPGGHTSLLPEVY